MSVDPANRFVTILGYIGFVAGALLVLLAVVEPVGEPEMTRLAVGGIGLYLVLWGLAQIPRTLS